MTCQHCRKGGSGAGGDGRATWCCFQSASPLLPRYFKFARLGVAENEDVSVVHVKYAAVQLSHERVHRRGHVGHGVEEEDHAALVHEDHPRALAVGPQRAHGVAVAVLAYLPAVLERLQRDR